MQTIILPGYSPKNKDWAEGIKTSLAPEISAEVVYWPHWQEGVEREENWITKEAEKVILQIVDEKINILSKSAGMFVAMAILDKKPELVNKLILCGVPITVFEQGDERFFEPLRSFPPKKLLVIQNKNDDRGSYQQVAEFVHGLNPEIKVTSKPRDDHEYPYPEDFKEFLT